jgi:glutathione S-transferase
LQSDHPEYGDYLNRLLHSDATLRFLQTIVLRYSQLEAKDRRQSQAVEDYSKWFISRLKRLNGHLPGREYLCYERFTVADIAIGYALYLAEGLGLDQFFEPVVIDYKRVLAFRKLSRLPRTKVCSGQSNSRLKMRLN